MENGTISRNGSVSEDHVLFQDDPWLYGTWLTNICIIAFGIAGNVVAFITHLRIPNKISMNYGLTFLAVVDFCLLNSIFFRWSVTEVGWVTYSNHVAQALYIAMLMFQLMSIWTIVYLSIDRYIAICHPLKGIRLCTVGRAKVALFCIFVCSVLYYSWRLYTVLPVADAAKTEQWYKTTYFIMQNIMDVIIVLFAPLCLLIVMNVRLMFAIRRARNDRRNMTSQESKRNLTAVINVVALITLFLVTQVTNLVLFILIRVELSGEKGTFSLLQLSRLSDAKNIPVATNSAFNIVIYCLFYKKFRDILFKVCLKRQISKTKSDRRRYDHTQIELLEDK